MSYQINRTNGTILTTLLDGTTNTETGLTLIGRNYTNYGEVQNENFVRLLENFAGPNPPGSAGSVGFNPMEGTLWWDTASRKLKIYNGNSFVSVSPILGSATAPTNNSAGDLWWDTANNQLSAWSGTGWILVGPAYKTSQGKSGHFVETLTDNENNPRTVLVEYVGGNAIAISSNSSFVLQSSTYGFSTITSGVNRQNNILVTGSANITGTTTVAGSATFNSDTNVKSVVPTANKLYSLGTNDKQFKDLYIGGAVALTDANIYFSNKSLVIQNKNYTGGIDIYVNTAEGNTKVAYVDGTSGLMYVSENPTSPLGIATKQYVDTVTGGSTGNLEAELAKTNANVATLTNSLNSNVNSLTNSINTNVATLTATDLNTNTQLTLLRDQVAADRDSNTLSFVRITADISRIDSAILGLAPLTSPAFAGNPTAPTPPPLDNTTRIATTSYVSTATTALSTDYNAKINSLTASTTTNLNNGLLLKANIVSPALSGTPTATTATPGDNSTRIATTAYVTSAIAAQKFNYTVSPNLPTGGNNGDFWFQIG